MTGEITIRTMRSEDIDAMLDINQRVTGKKRAVSWQQGFETYLRVYPLISLVALMDSKVVGFLLGDTSTWQYGLPLCAWIQIIGVSPDIQGKGIGRKLVDAFCKRCGQEGYVHVQALVRKDDDQLSNFYQKIGFSDGKLVNFERKT